MNTKERTQTMDTPRRIFGRLQSRWGIRISRTGSDSMLQPAEVLRDVARYTTTLGPIWLPADDLTDAVARDIRRGLVVDRDVVHALMPFVGPETTVIDVGAGYGQMAMLFAEHVGPQGHVHAIEPDKRAAHICSLNTNRYSNITLHRSVPSKRTSTERNDNSRGAPPLAVSDLAPRTRVSALRVGVTDLVWPTLWGALDVIGTDRPAIAFRFDHRSQDRPGNTFGDFTAFLDKHKYKIISAHGGFHFVATHKDA